MLSALLTDLMAVWTVDNLLVVYLIVCLWLVAKGLSLIPRQYLQAFDSTHRRSPIDGLRGILVLSVLTHHFYMTYYYRTTGVWSAPPNLVLENLGGTSVSLFFLITGYLFLTKIQKSHIDWKALYISRMRRIMPLFYGVVAIIYAISYYCEAIGHAKPLTPIQTLDWFFQWAIFYGRNFGDFPSWLIIAGVHWSLLYEWAFYFSLPLIYALLHRKFPPAIVLIFATLLCYYYFHLTYNPPLYYVLFAIACLPIVGKKVFKKIIAQNSPFLLLLLGILILVTYVFTQSYSWWQFLLLAIIFGFIANGYSFHNLLLNKGLCLLGDISYSIYLLHGIILYVVFTLANIYNFNAGLVAYYRFYPLIFIITILISLISYRYIEKPFIQKRPPQASN